MRGACQVDRPSGQIARGVGAKRSADGFGGIDRGELEHVELIAPPIGRHHVLARNENQRLVDEIDHVGAASGVEAQVEEGIDHTGSAADVALDGVTQALDDGFQIELAHDLHNVSLPRVVSEYRRNLPVTVWHRSYARSASGRYF